MLICDLMLSIPIISYLKCRVGFSNVAKIRIRVNIITHKYIQAILPPEYIINENARIYTARKNINDI